MSQYGFLFDLDGVIVDTAKYHFLPGSAWPMSWTFPLPSRTMSA